MDLRHMRHFIAVAEELHFGKAARRLHMAQPPLSQSIGRLEAYLGVVLLDRSRRGVKLTDAGRVFLKEAQRTLMQAELARKMAQREAAKLPEVRVSFVGPALYRVLPTLLLHHRGTTPDVAMRLFERSSPDQMVGLVSGDFDVAFVTRRVERAAGCETMVVERAHFLAAVPANSHLGERSSISLAELAEQPFILPPQAYADQSSDVLAMFERRGVAPNVMQEATQTNTTVALVGAGMGCSLVTSTVAHVLPRNVRLLRIEDDVIQPSWELLMAWHPDHISRLAANFVEATRHYLAENAYLLDPTAPPIQ